MTEIRLFEVKGVVSFSNVNICLPLCLSEILMQKKGKFWWFFVDCVLVSESLAKVTIPCSNIGN